MFSNSKSVSKDLQIKSLRNRIETLEFLLCQGQHDDIEINIDYDYDSVGGYIESTRVTQYRCKRCLRIHTVRTHI